MLYRRATALVAHWTAAGCELRNYVRGTTVPLNTATLAVLSAAGFWRTRRELAAAPGVDSNVDGLVRQLTRAGMLETSDAEPDGREKALAAWSEWSPSAAFFHLDTRDVTYADREAVLEHLPRRLLAVQPPRHADEASQPHIALTPYRRRGPFSSVLLARRSWRRFGRRPLHERELSALLGLTWGTQRQVRHPAGFELRFKTSPSPGALHSLEAYVHVGRVSGIAPGVYRYLADAHGLVRVGDAWSHSEMATRLGNQRWIAEASAVFFVACHFDRLQWKYPFARAYRTVLLEAGHFSQTFCLVATSLGLAPFCTAAFSDSSIEKQLGMNGVDAAVMYAMGAGTRPSGMSWAPVPRAKRKARK